jgi:hypothetical protein
MKSLAKTEVTHNSPVARTTAISPIMNPLLFQHLFRFFGHPEVYILILPGFGMVSADATTLDWTRHPPFRHYDTLPLVRCHLRRD